jgi:ketosteroid isomerase-like protein
MKLLMLAGAVLLASPVLAQLVPVPGDQRPTDRDAIRNHIDKIFQGFIQQDRENLQATHAPEWRGFLEGSRAVIRGNDQYMKSISSALTSPVHMTAYKMVEFDVLFYGDVAIVSFVPEITVGMANPPIVRKLRILDVYAKLNGHWIQAGSHTVAHPEAIAAQYSEARTITQQLRDSLIAARDAVWRACFANDRAKLDELLAPETVAINPGSEKWDNREGILAWAKGFSEAGGKLVRLEFPQTEIQVYGFTAMVYSTYLYETERDGQRRTQSGRATELFVLQNGKWVNTGWHLDSGR